MKRLLDSLAPVTLMWRRANVTTLRYLMQTCNPMAPFYGKFVVALNHIETPV